MKAIIKVDVPERLIGQEVRLYSDTMTIKGICEEEKVGGWIVVRDSTGCNTAYKCAGCGQLHPWKTNYCPSCGLRGNHV